MPITAQTTICGCARISTPGKIVALCVHTPEHSRPGNCQNTRLHIFLWNKLSFSHDYKSGGEQVLSHLPLSSLVHFRLIYWEILSGSSSTEPNHETPIYHLCLDAEKHKTNKICFSFSFVFFLLFEVKCKLWISHRPLDPHFTQQVCTLFFLTSRWKKDRINVVKHFWSSTIHQTTVTDTGLE